jgi:hypothetical protein
MIAGLYGIYLYNKKPADTRDQNPDFELSSTQLVKDFSADEQAASQKYNDRILLINGKVSEINLNSTTVILDAADPIAMVTCSFYADESAHLKNLKVGDELKIKGKCTGKLIDVILNNCRLSN